MILVYSERINNRLTYTTNLIFKHILLSEVDVTTDIERYKKFKGPKICYASKPLKEGIFIFAHTLLFEKGIKEQNLAISEHQNHKTLFSIGKEKIGFKHAALSFDPFAATFFLVSRYEEYLPFSSDKYGRFPGKESIAFKNNFLQEPVVNHYAIMLRELIKSKYPNFSFPRRSYAFIPTFDIDSAYAYKYKGVRNIGGYLKDLQKLNFNQIIDRTKVLLDRKKDPFDVYEWVINLQIKHKLKSIYFFQVGAYGILDKNISINVPEFQSLIKHIADYTQVALHPSFDSNKNFKQLEKELNDINQVLHTNVSASRQHFLKLNFPETYKNLIEIGIKNDYTMGYADLAGFRASIACPFYFYNLDQEYATDLKIHPFMVMDATFQYYKNQIAIDALPEIEQLIESTKAVKGTFITLWHNSSLSDMPYSIAWKNLFEQIVKKAK